MTALQKEGRTSVQYLTSVMMWAVVVAVFVGVMPVTSQNPEAVVLDSERCHGEGNCSLHVLECGEDQRLAVLEAAYGFKPTDTFATCKDAVPADPDTCVEDCCRYNWTTDCKQAFTADKLQRVQSECSYKTSCHLREQPASSVSCGGDRGSESTYSVVRALCVPEAVTVHPCSNITVNGSVVSLHHAHPHPHPFVNADTCYCRLDATDDNKDDVLANPTNVSIIAYDIHVGSGVQWSLDVLAPEEDGSPSLLQYSGSTSKFPTTELVRTSLPVSVRIKFKDVSATPQRVWLGFQGLEQDNNHPPAIMLRCGQHAVEYDQSHRSTSVSSETIRPAATPTPITKTTAATTVTKARTTDDDSDDGPSIPLVTSMIVLGIVVLGAVSALISRVRKRGWRRSFTCDIEKGPEESRSRSSTIGSGDATTTGLVTSDNNNVMKYNNQNGAVQKESPDDDDDEDYENDTKTEQETETDYATYLARRLSPHGWKKYRSESVTSRRSSFGNLENIHEAEDEPEAPQKTLVDFATLVASVHERLYKMGELDSDEDDEKEDAGSAASAGGADDSGGGRFQIFLGPSEHQNNVNITGTVQIFINNEPLGEAESKTREKTGRSGKADRSEGTAKDGGIEAEAGDGSESKTGAHDSSKESSKNESKGRGDNEKSGEREGTADNTKKTAENNTGDVKGRGDNKKAGQREGTADNTKKTADSADRDRGGNKEKEKREGTADTNKSTTDSRKDSSKSSSRDNSKHYAEVSKDEVSQSKTNGAVNGKVQKDVARPGQNGVLQKVEATDVRL